MEPTDVPPNFWTMSATEALALELLWLCVNAPSYKTLGDVGKAMSSYGAYLLQTLLLLVVVSALAVFVLFSAKKLGIGRPDGPIELVGRLPLDARRAVYLVKVGTEVLVVGASEAGLTKLGEVPAASLPPRVENTSAKTFSDALAKVLARPRRDSTEGDDGEAS